MDTFPEKVIPGGFDHYVTKTATRLLATDDTERYLDLMALKNEEPSLYLAVMFKISELREIKQMYEKSFRAYIQREE